MKISIIASKIECQVNIIEDAEFDYLILLGKKKQSEGKSLSFLLSEKYLDKFISEGIDSVICKPSMVDAVKARFKGGICTSEDPKTAFFEIHEALYELNKKEFPSEIDSTAIIHETAIINPTNVKIGKNVIIGPNCVIKSNVEIGDNTHMEEGCVIGTPAFYYYGSNDTRRLVKSTGGVRIGKNVGLHTNVSIERGVFTGNTVIEDNCALDNFVLVEHDCHIGQNVIVTGKVTLAGGVTVGHDCYLGVGSTVSNNISIGDNSKLCVGSVVSRDVPSDAEYAGNYAIEHSKFIKDLKNKLK